MNSPKLVSFLALLFIFAYLIFINYFFDDAHRWASLFYFYGFGLFTYFFSSWILIKMNCIQLSNTRDRKWFLLLCLGMIAVFFTHLIWTWLSLLSPYKGI